MSHLYFTYQYDTQFNTLFIIFKSRKLMLVKKVGILYLLNMHAFMGYALKNTTCT